MKVFLSWSGTESHEVAKVFKKWLPHIIESIKPYLSSEDIGKGKRWSADFSKELEDTTFGILCVTKKNLSAPWLNFEAGALSKTINESHVCPFLFKIKSSEISDHPILQFQHTIFEKEDIKKLMKVLNTASGKDSLSDEKLSSAFDKWYSDLEEELNKISSSSDESEYATK